MLVATSGQAAALRTPGRAGIVHSCGFSEERFGTATAGFSGHPWPDVMRRPIGVPVRTLALCPGDVPYHKEGDREDHSSQEDLSQHSRSHPVDGRGHAREAAHSAILTRSGYFRIDALGLKDDRQLTRRRNRHGTPSWRPGLRARHHITGLTLMRNRLAHANSHLAGKISTSLRWSSELTRRQV